MENSSFPGEVIMEFLHDELVNYATRLGKKDPLNKRKALAELEDFGLKAGYKIFERVVENSPGFFSEVDVVKFISTDFWNSLFKKDAKFLQTNSSGIYVIHDDSFRFLNKKSNGLQYLESAPLYMAFTAGIIRGALAYKGMESIVEGEVETMPDCKFFITMK